MKISAVQNSLMSLKEEGIRLDNKYKKLKIKKIKLEIAKMEKDSDFVVSKESDGSNDSDE